MTQFSQVKPIVVSRAEWKTATGGGSGVQTRQSGVQTRGHVVERGFDLWRSKDAEVQDIALEHEHGAHVRQAGLGIDSSKRLKSKLV